MKVELAHIISPKVKDIPYGECCTIPRYGNNMVLMHVKSHQNDVIISIVGRQKENTSKFRMLDLSTGVFHLLDPWEPCVLVKAVVNVDPS